MPSPGALLQSNAVKPPGLFSFKLPLCQLGGTFFAEKQNQIPNHSHGQRPSAIQRPAAPAAQVFLPPLHTQAFQVCFLRGCSPFFFAMCARRNIFTCACVMPCGHFFPWRIPNIAGFFLARFFQIFSLTHFCNSFLVHSLITYYSVVNPFLFYKMANLLLAFNSEFAIISAKELI